MDEDLDAIYDIFQAVVAKGDSYTFPEGMTREEVYTLWMGPGNFAYVACEGKAIVGSYTFHANQPGRGSHVANAAYMVKPGVQGKGIGKILGEHSLVTAKAQGFQAMQFNIVVSTNEPAVRLWTSLGFRVIGTTPKAFNHQTRGLVDAFIMHRFL